MADYGEWNTKGATLSDVTAIKEYGVDRDFIMQGIRAGKLEYREGSMHGNPYFKILRSQLETCITEEHGDEYLKTVKTQTELQRVKREINQHKRKLKQLEAQKLKLESQMV